MQAVVTFQSLITGMHASVFIELAKKLMVDAGVRGIEMKMIMNSRHF